MLKDEFFKYCEELQKDYADLREEHYALEKYYAELNQKYVDLQAKHIELQKELLYYLEAYRKCLESDLENERTRFL